MQVINYVIENLFRINQIKRRLIRDSVKGENNAQVVHYEVGKKVRKAIQDIGEMMPEEMPTPKKNFKRTKKRKD